MKIRVTLIGPGGELDHKIVDIRDTYPDLTSPRLQDEIHAAINSWTLCPGDSVFISEEEKKSRRKKFEK